MYGISARQSFFNLNFSRTWKWQTALQYTSILLRIWYTELLKKEKTLSTGARVYQLLFFIQTAGTSIFTTVSGFLSSLLLGLIGNTDDTTVLIIQCVVTALIVANGILTAFGYVFKPQATSSSALNASRQYSGLTKELIIEIKSYEVMFAGMTDADVNKFSSPDVGLGSRPDLSKYNFDQSRLGNFDQSRFPDLEGGIGKRFSAQLDDHLDDHAESRINSDLNISFETYKNRLLYYSTREQLITCTEPGLILIGYWGNKTVFDKTYVSNVLSQKDLQFLDDYINALENSREKRKMKKIVTRLYLHMGKADA